jgi:superfamily II DNA or RNA helicase
VQLRPYQQKAIDDIRREFRRGIKRVLLQLPTGGGKTVLTAKMLGTAMHRFHCWFIVHRKELIDQSAATFSEVGIPYGYVAADYRVDPFQPVQICSIDTLKRRFPKLRPPGLIVTDECHHASAAGWAKVLQAFPQAFQIGLTATPERLDGKGLDDHYDVMVRGPNVRWLMDNAYLADYQILGAPQGGISTDGMHSRYGEFVRAELEAAADKPTITGDAVKHYLKHARGKRGIVTCVSVKHSEHVAEQFRAAGVMAVHLDGNTPKDERRRAIQAFRDGHIMLLCNVALFGEGFDVPAAEVAIDLAPTKSLSMCLQRWGRVLRPKEDGGRALLLDHAGNVWRHGLPDDSREWSLGGREARQAASSESDIQVRQCVKCYACHRPAPKCPVCGHVYELKAREVDHVDGELQAMDPAEIRRRRNAEQGQARTLESLVALGRERGYRYPEQWAAKVWTSRQRRGAA